MSEIFELNQCLEKMFIECFFLNTQLFQLDLCNYLKVAYLNKFISASLLHNGAFLIEL